MTVQWRYCKGAEAEHRRNRRQYAHTYHYADTICVCRALWELPKSYRDGILLHEIGHLLAGPDGGEADANQAAREVLGTQIEYEDSPYGRKLERLKNMSGARIVNRQRVGNAAWEADKDKIELAHVMGRQRGEIGRLRREPMPPPWPREMMPELRRLVFGSSNLEYSPMLHPDIVDAYKDGYRAGWKGRR